MELIKELTTCITEVRKLREDLATASACPPLIPTGTTYAQITGRGTAGYGSSRRPLASQGSFPLPPTTSTLPLQIKVPTTKPALIITTKTPVGTRQETVEAFRKSISFGGAKYAPSKVSALAKNKLRVEFDSVRDCEDALRRLQDSEAAQVTAEPSKKLKPMIILKGISEDMPAEDLVGVLFGQNIEFDDFSEEDINFRFKRNNRNGKLYNAVFVVSPRLFRAAMLIGRIRLDHQRVYSEEFSPFLQCHSCLQFGHTRKHCRSEQIRCAHCAEPNHLEADCPTKGDQQAPPKCHNCAAHNARFPNKLNTQHRATSNSCRILSNIRAKIDNTIDYGQ
ncbi:jg21331 [Pararge aegeria aegeria]|uniref:Jg21331 protein n=1 Tax=Pararge aegeria aegeria TaxID=348720 RepID=A0A8S4R1B9_9NEOP|nr:jg21331 [Pararge aegeria aegeria]